MNLKPLNTLAFAACTISWLLAPNKAQAVAIDLTAVNSTYTTVDGSTPGAILTAESFGSTGTGTFKPFLRLQDSPFEQGFNTDGRDGFLPSNQDFAFDAKSDANFTRSLRTDSLLIDGGYFLFTIDLNEASNDVLLDAFDIYSSNVPDKDIVDIGSDPTQLGTLVFSISEQILLSDNFSGSGTSDVTVKIPASYFASAGTYLTLYTELGEINRQGDATSDGGFDEIAALTGENPPPPSVPEGGTSVALLGLTLAGLGAARRFTKKA